MEDTLKTGKLCKLFDIENQSTFITGKFQRLLKLKILRTENVIIDTIGTIHETKLEKLDLRNVKVVAFYYPLICKPLDKPEVLLAMMNHGNLSNQNSKEDTFK